MNSFSATTSIALLLTALAIGQTPAKLTVDLSKPKAPVSPMLYGLMTEEINYSYDGGLYAELVRNRVFRDQTFTTEKHDPAHWALVQKGDAQASMVVQKATGPSTALTDSLKLSVERADAASPAGV